MSEQAQQGSDVLEAITKQLQQSQTSGDQSGGIASGLDISSLMGGISTTVIVINIAAGIIGTFYFMYGRRRSNVPMIASGALLCTVPFFITNVYGLALFCLTLLVVPYLADRYSLFN